MIKAFLSHSSANKEFVRSVALQLGRQFCIVDEQVFDNGEEFKSSIEKHLDDTSVFVLFASKASVKSIWVDFEINEAGYRTLEKTIARSIVFLIDSDVDHNSLPRWLQRAKVVRNVAPKSVARDIRQHIDDLLREEQHRYFEGRTADLSAFQRLITPLDGPPPRVFAVYGLPSIGRRTFLRNAARISLGFARTIHFAIAEGDALPDLAIRIANDLEPYSTRAGFENIVTSIRASTEDQLVARIVADLSAAIKNRELPVLIDEGGALTEEGLIALPLQRLLSALQIDDQNYLCLVCSRRPDSAMAVQHLGALSSDDIQRLISRLARNSVPPLVITPKQMSELAEYVNGYPPSAYYAVSLASEYGIAAVLADKQRLVEFRTAALIRYLRTKTLSAADRSVLAVLGRYSPLPIEVLSETVHLDDQSVARTMYYLIDHSLVVLAPSGLYAIAEPMADVVHRELTEEVDHNALYAQLKALVNDDETYLPRLDLYRLLFKAATMARIDGDELFHFASDLIKLTQEFYHQREYQRAIQYGKLAVAERPDSAVALDFLVRALIQEEEWEEAAKRLKDFERIGPARDASYLHGFLERKRGRLRDAIKQFLDAIRLGRTGQAIQREIAYCYFLDGDISAARKHLLPLVEKPNNRIALDLWIQIAEREHNEVEARKGLSQLEVLELEPFYFHRLSTVELSFGNVNAALEASKRAIATAKNGKPTFGMLAQLATCQLHGSKYDDADATIRRLERDHPRRRVDVRLGLNCRMEIMREHFGKALEIFEHIHDTSAPVYKAMKRDALSGELKVSALSDELRARYLAEVEELGLELKTYDERSAWLRLIE